MSQLTNGIGWFEIGTDDVAATERFYGEVLGWTFRADGNGSPYRVIDTGAADSIGGGVRATGGQMPNYAVFFVEVDDVAATCAKVERSGGTVLSPPVTTPRGLVSAQVSDPSGNRFGLYSPPPAADAD